MVRRQIRPLLKIADKAGSQPRRPKEKHSIPSTHRIHSIPIKRRPIGHSKPQRLFRTFVQKFTIRLCCEHDGIPQKQNQHSQQILRFCRNVGSGLTPSCPAVRRRKKQTLPGGKFSLPQEPSTLYKERRKIKAEAPSAEAEGRRV